MAGSEPAAALQRQAYLSLVFSACDLPEAHHRHGSSICPPLLVVAVAPGPVDAVTQWLAGRVRDPIRR
jgi:hypothetical protein